MIDLYLIRKLMLGASSYHFMLVGMVEVVVVTVQVVVEEVAATAQGSLADATVAIMISFIITIISCFVYNTAPYVLGVHFKLNLG